MQQQQRHVSGKAYQMQSRKAFLKVQPGLCKQGCLVKVSVYCLIKLDLFNCQFVQIKNQGGKIVVGVVKCEKQLQKWQIQMSYNLRKLLDVKFGDWITITPLTSFNQLIEVSLNVFSSYPLLDEQIKQIVSYFQKSKYPINKGQILSVELNKTNLFIQISELISENNDRVDWGQIWSRTVIDLKYSCKSIATLQFLQLNYIKQITSLWNHITLSFEQNIAQRRNILLIINEQKLRNFFLVYLAQNIKFRSYSIDGRVLMNIPISQALTTLQNLGNNVSLTSNELVLIKDLDQIFAKDYLRGSVQRVIRSQVLHYFEVWRWQNSNILVIATVKDKDSYQNILNNRFRNTICFSTQPYPSITQLLFSNIVPQQVVNEFLIIIEQNNLNYAQLEATLSLISQQLKHFYSLNQQQKQKYGEYLIKDFLKVVKQEVSIHKVQNVVENLFNLQQEVRWQNIYGLATIKQYLLQSALSLPNRQYTTFMSPSKNILLYGAKGCGKTLLAKALAYECCAKCINIKAEKLLAHQSYYSHFSSESPIMSFVYKNRPCVVVIQNLQKIFYDEQQGNHRSVNSILTFLDGLTKEVIFIGTSSRPQLISDTFIRPGRMWNLIYVPPPLDETRANLIENSCGLRLAKDNIEDLVKCSKYMSCKKLIQLCKYAKQHGQDIYLNTYKVLLEQLHSQKQYFQLWHFQRFEIFEQKIKQIKYEHETKFLKLFPNYQLAQPDLYN